MTAVIGWTTLVIAVPIVVALVSTLLGFPAPRAPLFGGPFVILALAFSLLNTAMLGAGIVAAHIRGPVTEQLSRCRGALHRMIYLPYLITAGVPLAASGGHACGRHVHH